MVIKQDMFVFPLRSALHIVRDAIRDHLGDSTEHDSILRHTQYLVNNANYARKILKRKQLLSATPEERQVIKFYANYNFCIWVYSVWHSIFMVYSRNFTCCKYLSSNKD